MKTKNWGMTVPEQLQKKIDHYEFLMDFITHEVRNPLASVVMFARMMREGSYGEISGRHQEILDRILANTSRIEHMLDDFYNMSQIESSERYSNPETLWLHREIILPVIDSLEKKHLFTQEQKEAFQCTSTGDVKVRVDRTMFNVVFDNLFFNAVKYGRPGGRIEYGWKMDDGWLEVGVRNEGQGVPAGDLERIFEKFVRLRDPNIPLRRGTGLGLYNVRKMVEMHGGRIWADSEYGRSFNISLTLPLDAADNTPPEQD